MNRSIPSILTTLLEDADTHIAHFGSPKEGHSIRGTLPRKAHSAVRLESDFELVVDFPDLGPIISSYGKPTSDPNFKGCSFYYGLIHYNS